MPSKKRVHNENASFSFVTVSRAAPRRRLKAVFHDQENLLAEQVRLVEEQRQTQAAAAQTAKVAQEEAVRAAEQSQCTEVNERLNSLVRAVRSAQFTLPEFLLQLIQTNDRHLSSEITCFLDYHGPQFLDLLYSRRPQLMQQYTLNAVRSMGERESILEDCERIAPTICTLLRSICMSAAPSERRDQELVLATAICMLVQARSERSNISQSILCIYLLACGASRSLFEVLHHAGLSSSYSKAVRDLRGLSKARLEKIQALVRERPFMIVWDNLNIPFRVGEQRQDSKDHFDNGTTATLIPLYGVSYGQLSLSMKTPRMARLPLLQFEPGDLLPSPTQVQQLEDVMLWHIEDILLAQFPKLRERFQDRIAAFPHVKQIPVHKTEQHPLPAMHIDESSLDGTMEVLDTIVNTLSLDSDSLKNHGVVICAGDQLSVSLLDKVHDEKLTDNYSQWTEGQLGLFHVKIAGARMVANEYWGTANSLSPWSLWKVNSLLARKPLSAGWKAKALPPFRPIWDLIIQIMLPAHILDAYRRVQQDRDSAAGGKPRDILYENVRLFNRDSLILHAFGQAVKHGEIGVVMTILAHWMVMFRGTGRMPKYADALFECLLKLKHMHPDLREAFLLNWLVNLTSHPDGFKEVDLLQEHHNFWAKIIYNAKGSGRSWDWLGMITVAIFALRDVLRKVKENYKTPHNDHLERERLHTFTAARPGNEFAAPARDLITHGAMYANTARAFKTFRADTRQTVNKGVPKDVDSNDPAAANISITTKT
ncbi:hypothetical protein OE88DRAFT_1712644 [Heliocybe sulcata]|uniref:DUF6589 domain-containing protein n=1 Tax=Heliocybe sulcata TaxID=5364 RepID=A0A5C3N2R5_9AGAM|nr:hypothetical protein OE88DRAFT_1712644 [Heliocybe sulcata]